MKEIFWEGNRQGGLITTEEKLFDYLWNRGGKQFYNYYPEHPVNELAEQAESDLESTYGRDAQDFLDCVEINEEKVKELIKELK